MFSNKLLFIIAACFTAVLLTSTSHAIYFTLELKNGNEIITDHYTEDSSSVIHFYTNEGAVSMPKSLIKSIKSNDGSITIDVEQDQKRQENMDFLDEGEEEQAYSAPAETDTGKEQFNSINDQIAVINANLDNLSKNRNIFISQQEQYQQQKQKSEERIAAFQKSADADSQSTRETIELEQTRLKDLESKLVDIQQRIENNDKISQAQERIKQRFEADLSKLKK